MYHRAAGRSNKYRELGEYCEWKGRGRGSGDGPHDGATNVKRDNGVRIRNLGIFFIGGDAAVPEREIPEMSARHWAVRVLGTGSQRLK